MKKKGIKKRIIIHKKRKEKVKPVKLAFVVGISAAILSFLITFIAITFPESSVIANPLKSLYSSFGYSVSPVGLILGTAYSFTDVFIMIWIISVIYNRFIKD